MEEAVESSAEPSTWRVQGKNQAASEGVHTALGCLSSLLLTKVSLHTKNKMQNCRQELQVLCSSLDFILIIMLTLQKSTNT